VQLPDPKRAEDPPRLCTDGDSTHELTGWIGNGLSALAHVFDREQNGLTRVGQCLIRRFALAVAAGEGRDDRDVATVGVRLKHNVIARLIHTPSLDRPSAASHGSAQLLQDLRHSRLRNPLPPRNLRPRRNLFRRAVNWLATVGRPAFPRCWIGTSSCCRWEGHGRV
jgi:hypothetical protein